MLWNSLEKFLPILILLAVIAVVIRRLPKIDLGHSQDFLQRRLMNWLPLGLTYAMLYMGRYNLTVAKNAFGDLMTKADFGTIFFWGTLTYGCAFIINGPLTDRIGGRKAILLGAAGAAVANLGMGVVTYMGITSNLVLIFSVLYAINMYFQSFGAVSIVKVNAHWFHLRERGTFGGIFGILISLGIYFAFDWGRLIVSSAPTYWVFFVPTIALAFFWVIDYWLVRDMPSEAGYRDFDTEDASSHDTGEQLTVWQVAQKMLSNPVILTIGAIEFCSGFLRNAIMHWYYIFAKQTGLTESFTYNNWGLLLCCAGIMGGVFAGTLSDHLFQSRRGPVASVLYGGMVLGGVALLFALGSPSLGLIVVFMSLCVIGVHGMLSGTASMDFGGKKNVGVAVGLIDGLVYLGTATQAIVYGWVLPNGAAAKDPSNWTLWPVLMLPMAILGFVLALRVWNAKPSKDKKVANAGAAEKLPAGAVAAKG